MTNMPDLNSLLKTVFYFIHLRVIQLYIYIYIYIYIYVMLYNIPSSFLHFIRSFFDAVFVFPQILTLLIFLVDLLLISTENICLVKCQGGISLRHLIISLLINHPTFLQKSCFIQWIEFSKNPHLIDGSL